MSVRKPVFAGTWYPADAGECERMIRSFLQESRFDADIAQPAVAGIVPHAGWVFSGDLACRVISALRGQQNEPAPDVIAVFGMHLPPGAQPHIMTRGSWQTPFGELEIAADTAEAIASQYQCKIETAEDFTPDNGIELQLPFVKYFFGSARLLPIGAPPSDTAIRLGQSVAEAALERGLTIKVIGSTDLTHYGPNFGFTPAGAGKAAFEWVKNENDKRVIDRMLELDAEGVVREGLSNQNACCAGAAAAAITAARHLGANKAHLVGYSSSYEKNPGSTFVGYGGLVYTL